MNVERERVRELVREELARKLVPSEPYKSVGHPALIVIHLPEEDPKELDAEESRPCVIEPDRPCYQSGYCKRLGY